MLGILFSIAFVIFLFNLVGRFFGWIEDFSKSIKPKENKKSKEDGCGIYVIIYIICLLMTLIMYIIF